MIENVTFSAGHIILHRKHGGPPQTYKIADVLRAADIPLLTYEQVTSIKALANMVVILIRTLMDRNVIDENFLEAGDLSLDDLVEAIENMGGDFGDPDLSGSET